MEPRRALLETASQWGQRPEVSQSTSVTFAAPCARLHAISNLCLQVLISPRPGATLPVPQFLHPGTQEECHCFVVLRMREQRTHSSGQGLAHAFAQWWLRLSLAPFPGSPGHQCKKHMCKRSVVSWIGSRDRKGALVGKLVASGAWSSVDNKVPRLAP